MTYSDICHDQLEDWSERPVQCVIYAGAHKSENHKYKVIRCATKKENICIYIIPKCVNCWSNH